MFQKKRNKAVRRIFATFLSVVTVLSSVYTGGLTVRAAEGDLVQDFESFTTDAEVAAAFTAWGNATFKLVNKADDADHVCSGEKALSVTERSGDYTNLVVPGIAAFAGKEVKISYDVKTTAGKVFTGTVQQGSYDWVATTTTTGEWNHAEGTVTIKEEPQNLYFQLLDSDYATACMDDFYVDNIKIEIQGAGAGEGGEGGEGGSGEQGPASTVQDFESFTSDADLDAIVGTWGSGVTYKLVDKTADADNVCAGEKALAAIDRVNGSNMVMKLIPLGDYAGKKIKISYDVKTTADKRFTAVLQQKADNEEATETKYTWCAGIDGTTGGWDHVEEEVEVMAVPLNLYFQMAEKGSWNADASDDFYFDNFKIEVVGGNNSGAGEQDPNPVADTIIDFESFESDAAVDAFVNTWGETRPTFKLANKETEADNVCSGEKALAVTNRVGGPNLVIPGLDAYSNKKVKISYDVKTAAGRTFTAVAQQEGGDNDYPWVGRIAETTGGWDHAEGEVELVNAKNLFFQLMEGGSWDKTADDDFYIDNIKIEVVGGGQQQPAGDPEYVDTTDYEKLAELYKEYFTLGVAVQDRNHWGDYTKNAEIGNPAKEKLVKEQFTSITFGNELKPAYNFSPDVENYFKVDNSAKVLLDWAKENGIGVRGHVLLWHGQTQGAFFAKDFQPTKGGQPTTDDADKMSLDEECLADRDTMLDRMQKYVYGAMEYIYANNYADVVYAWDVVNEAADESKPDGMRTASYWRKIVGPDFIYYAFLYAREAEMKFSKQYAANYGLDPEGDLSSIQPKLFYNDYNEWFENRSNAIVNYLTKVKYNEDRHITSDVIKADGDGTIYGDGLIDGIGMQGHINDTQDIDQYMAALEKYNAAVGEVHITELDIGKTGTNANAEYYQGKYFYDFFTRLIDEVTNKNVNLTCVTIWGLTDDSSWREGADPLMFRGDLSKKPAFDAMVMAAKGEAFGLEPEFIQADLSNKSVSFESRFEGEGEEAVEIMTKLSDTGLDVRGGGKLEIQKEVAHDGDYALKDSGRTASWNGICFDVARFAGQEIEVSAWVRCEGDGVKLSVDIPDKWPNLVSVPTGDAEWHQVYTKLNVPYGVQNYVLYFETISDAEADIYLDDLEVRLIGMNESFEQDTHNGVARATGHQPVIAVVDGGKTGDKALKVTRTDNTATVKFDASAYIGKSVTVSAYVKTADVKIALGFDSSNPVQMAEVASTVNEWTLVEGTYNIPSDVKSAYFYLETDGISDMLVDDVKITMNGLADDGDDGLFRTRWNGAGTLSVEEENGNKVVKLTNREQGYYGVAWDMADYAGFEVEVSVDVRSEGTRAQLTAEYNSTYNYVASSEAVKADEFVTLVGRYRIPAGLSSVAFYVEDDSTGDFYVDNMTVRLVALTDEPLVGPEPPVEEPVKFADVPEEGWKNTAATFAYKNNVMSGVATKEDGSIVFDPDKALTRAMFVTVLYSMEGKPEVEFEEAFSDVAAGQWYSKAVTWAYKNGITAGYNDGTFKPNAEITREQFVVMLRKYAELKGKDVTADETATAEFVDKDDVSSWAKTAVNWAVANGYVSGKPSTSGVKIAPAANTTRVECAAIMRSYLTR